MRVYAICFPAQAKGLGYAISTAEELKFVKEIATATGVILDPVYRYSLCLVLFVCLVAALPRPDLGLIMGLRQNEDEGQVA